MHTEVTVCIQEGTFQQSSHVNGDRDNSPHAYGDHANPCMHTGITQHAVPVCIRGSRSILVCIRGSHKSLYAYGDRMKIPVCKWGARHVIPICIRGLILIPVCKWVSRRSPYAYGDCMDTNPHMHTGICASLYAYGDFSVTNRMHTGNIFTWEIKSCIPICVIVSNIGIAVCMWGSPYANGRGLLKSSHMVIPLRIMKLCAYGD